MAVVATPHPNHDKRWIILGFLGLAQLMVVLDSTIVNIALPSAQASLGFSNVDRQWLITAYSLAFGSVLLLGGRLSDLVGRKTALQIGLLGFAVASAIGGASTSFDMLVVARAVQGAFGAVLAPAALAMLTTTFTDPVERGKAFGIFGGIAGSGAAVGLLLGGVLTEYLTWRWTLYVNLAIAAAALVGTQILLLRERGAAKGGLDVPSTLLIGGGLFSIVYALSNAATYATNSASSGGSLSLASAFLNTVTIVLFVVGVVLIAAFVWRQLRLERPMLPMGVLTDRARGGSFLSILIAAGSMFAIFLFLTYYLQTVLRYTPVMTGLAFLPMVVVLVACSATSQIVLLPRLGPRPLVPTGMVLGTVGMFLFTRLTVAGSYTTQVLPALLVTGAGIGLIFATAMNTATARVPAEYAGSASATVNVSQQVGASIGTALFSTVAISASLSYTITLLRRLQPSSPPSVPRSIVLAAQVHGYTTAFWWSAGLFAIGAIVSVAILPSGKPQPVTAERELVSV